MFMLVLESLQNIFRNPTPISQITGRILVPFRLTRRAGPIDFLQKSIAPNVGSVKHLSSPR